MALKALAFFNERNKRRSGLWLGASLSLGLAFGAATALYSVVDTLFLQPLPYPNPDQLVYVERQQGPERIGPPVSPPAYFDLVRDQRVFSDLAASTVESGIVLTQGANQSADRQLLARVSGNYFQTFGIEPVLGRLLVPRDDAAEAPPVVVLSEAYWRSRFASSPAVIGQEIRVNGIARTVVGVWPANVRLPARAQLAETLALNPSDTRRGNNYLNLVARLAPGQTLDIAQAQMKQLAQGLAAEFPANHAELDFRVRSVIESETEGARPVVALLLTAIGLLTLVGCASLANLLLADVVSRRRELATRSALGASPWGLAGQLLRESALLTAGGVALGMPIGWLALRWLVTEAPTWMPRLDQLRLSPFAIGVAIATAAVVALLCGLLPARLAASARFGSALRSSGRRAGTDASELRLRRGLVVVQIGLSLALSIGAALLGESLRKISRIDPGFDPKGLASMAITLPPEFLPEGSDVGDYRARTARGMAFFERVEREVEALPQVESAGFVFRLPMVDGTGVNGDFSIVGDAPPEQGKAPLAEFQVATPGYFETLRLDRLRGEAFEATARPMPPNGDAPRTILINQALADLHFKGRNPIGRVLNVIDGEYTIRGVVENARQNRLDRPAEPEVYLSYLASPLFQPDTNLVVRTTMPLNQLVPAVRAIVDAATSGVPVYGAVTLEQAIEQTNAERSFLLTVVGFFALAALVIAGVSLYAVLAHAVAERTNEIGVRLALGSSRGRILRAVAIEGALLVGLGSALGAIASVFGSSLLANQLYGVSAERPLDALAAFVAVLVAATVSILFPAVAAARTDPGTLLRSE